MQVNNKNQQNKNNNKSKKSKNNLRNVMIIALVAIFYFGISGSNALPSANPGAVTPAIKPHTTPPATPAAVAAISNKEVEEDEDCDDKPEVKGEEMEAEEGAEKGADYKHHEKRTAEVEDKPDTQAANEDNYDQTEVPTGSAYAKKPVKPVTPVTPPAPVAENPEVYNENTEVPTGSAYAKKPVKPITPEPVAETPVVENENEEVPVGQYPTETVPKQPEVESEEAYTPPEPAKVDETYEKKEESNEYDEAVTHSLNDTSDSSNHHVFQATVALSILVSLIGTFIMF